MCGIVGFIDFANDEADRNMHQLKCMSDSIPHRGPDADGVWSDPNCNVYIGHRRLSILDLSPEGAQPMPSSCGRYIVSYNGEIYNFAELKKILENRGHIFRGHSDTEILVEYISIFGIKDALKIIKGMFAIALWDKKRKSLFLTRDHFGKKPLYYGLIDGKLFFCSELKSVLSSFESKPKIDRAAYNQYLRFGFISSPNSIFENVYKLRAAHYIEFDVNALCNMPSSSLVEKISNCSVCYWDVRENIKNENQNFQSDEEILETFKKKIFSAVEQRMVSDVPLGAFLSGGLDSSLIVSVMMQISEKPVKTFSIGFNEGEFDESHHARSIAKHLGADHHEFFVSDDEARGVIPQLSYMYDEPFSDVSQIPTYYVCQRAAQDVTVVLSGDGGDEFFYGYSRYFMIEKLFKILKSKPHLLKSFISQSIHSAPKSLLNAICSGAGISHKRLLKIAECLPAQDFDELVRRAMSNYQDPKVISGYAYEHQNVFTNGYVSEQVSDYRDRLMLFDILQYMTDDVLVKVDRASMINSIEVRCPLLDKDLAQWALSVPANKKILGNATGKKMIHDLLGYYVPSELYDRPKQGFSVPIAQWLRGPLNEWANDYLSTEALQKSSLHDTKLVRRLWEDFQAGKHESVNVLWSVLMGQTWHERWMS